MGERRGRRQRSRRRRPGGARRRSPARCCSSAVPTGVAASRIIRARSEESGGSAIATGDRRARRPSRRRLRGGRRGRRADLPRLRARPPRRVLRPARAPLFDALNAAACAGRSSGSPRTSAAIASRPTWSCSPTGSSSAGSRSTERPRSSTCVTAGRIPLDLYRGRTIYAPPVQAAEIAVRSITGADGIGDLRLVAHDDDLVTFATPAGDLTVRVEQRPGPLAAARAAVPSRSPRRLGRLARVRCGRGVGTELARVCRRHERLEQRSEPPACAGAHLWLERGRDEERMLRQLDRLDIRHREPSRRRPRPPARAARRRPDRARSRSSGTPRTARRRRSRRSGCPATGVTVRTSP